MTVSFNGDFSTGNDKQWKATGSGGGTQDSTTNKDTTNAHFGPLKFLQDQSGRPGWWGQFNVPAAPTVKQRCQVITSSHPIRHDVDDFITLRVHTAAGWTDGNPAWPIQIIEPNFQALGAGQANFCLILKPTHIGVALLAGKSYPSGSGPYVYEYRSNSEGANNNLPKMYAIPKGKFSTGIAYELIVHIKWKFDRTGIIETWYRPLGNANWTRTTSQAGFPTLQQNPDGTYKPTTIDCHQLYRGASQAACKVSMNGYTICDSFVAADAQLSGV
jgi:hypothetical protein